MAPETATETRRFILDLVENYHDPCVRSGTNSMMEQPPPTTTTATFLHHVHFAFTEEQSADDSIHPPPPLFRVLEETSVLSFLEWKDIGALRGVTKELKSALHTQVESRIIEYFRPTSELIRVVNTILHDVYGGSGSGWPRFIQMVLLPLMVRIENRCRPRGIIAPLLYRIFWMRDLVRILDGSEKFIFGHEVEDYADDVWWFCDVQTTKPSYVYSWFDAVELEKLHDTDRRKLLGCPDLMFYQTRQKRIFQIEPLSPDDEFYVGDDFDDDDDDDDDPPVNHDERVATKLLWERSLPLCVRGTSPYMHFALTPPSSSDIETDASLAMFDNTEASEAFGHKVDRPCNILKLLLSLNNIDFRPWTNVSSAHEDFEIEWCGPSPAGLVLWYTFLVAMKISPFVEAAVTEECSPKVLWKIVSKDISADEQQIWTDAMQYYSSLSLYYGDVPNNDRKGSSSQNQLLTQGHINSHIETTPLSPL